MRSGTGALRMSLQPGMSQMPQKLRKLMFIGTCTGMVSATSRPPSSAARSPAESWRGTRSGSRASTVSTFQLSGRLAAALTWREQLDLVVGELVEAALHDAFEGGARVLRRSPRSSR